MERRGDTHRILEAGPQVLHGIVELSLLPQGSKDEALDVLRQGGQQREEGETRRGGREVRAGGGARSVHMLTGGCVKQGQAAVKSREEGWAGPGLRSRV